jgi:hypothetical protein
MSLFPPLVEKTRIERAQYPALSETVNMLAANYDHIWFVKIIPQKKSGFCRTRILAPDSFGTGAVILETSGAGRIPATAPPKDQEDLRPMSYYAIGKGSHKFRITIENSINYVETTVNFD